MLWFAVVVVVAIVAILLIIRVRKARHEREYVENSIDPETLHEMFEHDPKILLVDVRQPLDLLAYSETIPGATRIPPKQLMADPDLLPRDRDVVMYCTCEAQKTSLEILRHAKALGFFRLKVLRGGLAAWKSKGYPVDAYRESFRLDTVV